MGLFSKGVRRNAVLWALAAGLVGGAGAGCFAEARAQQSDAASDLVLTRVRAYLRQQGGPQRFPSLLETGHLRLPSPPPTGAALQVSGGRWDALHQEYQFYLRCRNPKDCRPFLAMLRVSGEGTSAVVPGLGRARVALEAPLAQAVDRAQLNEARLSQALVQAGEHVRLRLASPGLQIRMEAICLEPGRLGQQVRARGVGETRTFRAEVVGPRQLAMEVE